MNKQHIPNFNTISTILDRFVIERVKYNQFLQRQISGEDMNKEVEVQERMCEQLQHELEYSFAQIFESGSYETMLEERTFK
jgi:hypothetical protein